MRTSCPAFSRDASVNVAWYLLSEANRNSPNTTTSIAATSSIATVKMPTLSRVPITLHQ